LTAVAGSILTIAVANKRKLALGLKNPECRCRREKSKNRVG
jgi:hypothetical protein